MMICARLLLLVSLGTLLPACASIYADHFYALQKLPAGPLPAGDHFSRELTVQLAVPSVVDRNQMILLQDNGVVVLEHERWASPLVDQLNFVLGQDIEQRRPDILVTTRPVSQAAGMERASVQVDVVDLTLRRSGPVTLEARWRVESSGTAGNWGRASFSATPQDSSPSALAAGVSRCLADLAGRLSAEVGAENPQPK